MKFTVLDDLFLWQRTLLLLICGLTCSWGFINNTILLVLASKIGFPLAVAACAITNNPRQILSVLYYTVWLTAIGAIYFWFNSAAIVPIEITRNYIPTWHDFILAIGLGWALSHFWNHAIRINIIVLSAGLSSLLPACVLAGYWLVRDNIPGAVGSLELYFQYIVGMCIGAVADQIIFNRKQNVSN